MCHEKNNSRLEGWNSITVALLFATMDLTTSLDADDPGTAACGNYGAAPNVYLLDTQATATPGGNVRFDHWIGDVPSGDEDDNLVTLTMAGEKALMAHFVHQPTLVRSAAAPGIPLKCSAYEHSHDPNCFFWLIGCLIWGILAFDWGCFFRDSEAGSGVLLFC